MFKPKSVRFAEPVKQLDDVKEKEKETDQVHSQVTRRERSKGVQLDLPKAVAPTVGRRSLTGGVPVSKDLEVRQAYEFVSFRETVCFDFDTLVQQ